MRRMHGVDEQHRLVGAGRIEKALVGFDEGLLLFRVELASDRLRLHVFEPEPMQHGDEPRAALVDDAEFPRDIGSDQVRRARQSLGDPGLQLRFLLRRQVARAAAAFEAPQTLHAVRLIGLAPASDRVVVEIQRLGDLLAAPAVVEQQQGVGPSRQALLAMPVAQQRQQFGALAWRKKTAANYPPSRIRKPSRRNTSFRPLNESGYSEIDDATPSEDQQKPSACADRQPTLPNRACASRHAAKRREGLGGLHERRRCCRRI